MHKACEQATLVIETTKIYVSVSSNVCHLDKYMHTLQYTVGETSKQGEAISLPLVEKLTLSQRCKIIASSSGSPSPRTNFLHITFEPN